MKEPVAASHAGEPPIYLDYNATTPIIDPVRRAIEESLDDFGNPSSTHAFGRRAHERIASGRAEVALLLGCRPEEIVFTSGGSEANNFALTGVARPKGQGHIITCAGEHPAILEVCAFLERGGWRVTRLPIDGRGQVDPAAVAEAIRADTILISVMHANNETGTVQPIAAIARIARERGVLLHTDAAQSIGKIPTRVNDLGVDLLSVAGHKLYAPKGCGALYVRSGVELEPLIHGAGHEGGRRAGTEAVHQIAALGAACRAARTDSTTNRILALRDRLHALLREAIGGLGLNGHPSERLPNTLNVNFPKVAGAALIERTRSVAASTGSACHAGETRLSPVLAAMGVAPDVGRGAVRLSLGRPTTAEEIDSAAEALIRAHGELTR